MLALRMLRLVVLTLLCLPRLLVLQLLLGRGLV
jgi:hypothetical protein